MSDFLPTNYQMQEQQSNYMQFKEGRNTFRILSSAIVGWEWWEQDGEGNRLPQRVKTYFAVPDVVKNIKEKKDRAREFWAFVVYNRDLKQIQILELKQQTIMRDVKALVDNPKWGSPTGYDLAIDRIKTGSNPYDVEYSVMPEPKEPLDEAIQKLNEDMAVNLSALYEGADPFAAGKVAEGDKIAEDAAAAIG